jgi:hypothetical protein
VAQQPTPRRLLRRTARGSDPQTPALALTGVAIVVGSVVVAVLAVAFAIYYLLT